MGALVVGWDEPQDFPAADVDLIAAFAAQCAQALHRLRMRQAERAVTAATRGMSEALQRSLLTEPPRSSGLEIIARYQPAARDAQVGGDWYDAFRIDGITRLVVGDVAGHDRSAAATMGELRNLLRGVAHATRQQPSAVLRALDEAMADLDVTTVATAVLAHIEPPGRRTRPGSLLLRWSNAGHPPPLHIRADGTAGFLDADPDLLLGVDPATERHEHTRLLEPGTTVLLFTDGLIERRGATLTQGLRWLRRWAARAAEMPLPDLCDALLRDIDDLPADDVVLLALRVHRPATGAT
jgi:serine phosphatase RsbU (regulator of sigma subunit)